MKKLFFSLLILPLFSFFSATPSFATNTLTVSNPRVVNNDFNIDIQITGAPDNICSWWTSLHNVYLVDLNGNRLHNFSNCGYVATDPDGTVHYTFSGSPQPPTGTYKVEVIEQEQNNYDVISDNTFDWTSTINFPPSVQTLANTVLTPGQTYTGNGSFTDTDSSFWTATVDYGDGSGVQPLTLSGMNYSLSHIFTQNGSYLITVTVTDEHENSGTTTAQVSVEADDLSVSNPRLNSSGEFTIDLNVSAPDNVCSWWTVLHHAYVIDAITGQQYHDFANCSSNGSNNYTISGVGVLPVGTYKLEVLESEQPGLNGESYDVISTNSFVWTNQAPQLTSLNGGTIDEGGTYTENASFNDVDSTSWTATVDYGDGSGVQSLILSGMNFNLSHQYNSAGTYTVVVNIIDNQGATGTTTATITVNSLQPVTTSFNASADTYVRSGQGNQNEGGGQFMKIQSSGDNRSLVLFDQSAMQSQIGNKQVLSAKLRVTITDNGNNWGTTGRTIDAHRLITNWNEGNGTENDRGTGSGATWNCAIDSAIQNQAKDCNGTTEWEMGQPNNPAVHPWFQTASATQNITNNQSGVVEFDVTADVANFLNGTKPNYGWIIKKTQEGQNGQVSFGTKESSSVPQLVVTY